ncbi:MAG: DUF364 domain-containing protein [Desulfobacteraceae bacterium]|jgi:hypothetical protein
MNILKDLISTLHFDVPVRDIRQGVFHTAVKTRYCGLAATLPRDALRQHPPLVQEPGILHEKDPSQLVRLAFSERILEAAIGMATINSLLDVDEDSCVELNAAELILEKGKGGNVAVIGHFPFIPRVQKAVQHLWVIEKNPKEQDFSEEHADRVIPQADVVAITGTALTNHTLPGLLDLCDPKAYVILLGDTVPLSPVLFDYPIDALSGTRVMDEDLAMQCVAQGANFRQIQGTKRLTLTRS